MGQAARVQACAAASEPHRDVADAFGGAGEMPRSAEGTGTPPLPWGSGHSCRMALLPRPWRLEPPPGPWEDGGLPAPWRGGAALGLPGAERKGKNAGKQPLKGQTVGAVGRAPASLGAGLGTRGRGQVLFKLPRSRRDSGEPEKWGRQPGAPAPGPIAPLNPVPSSVEVAGSWWHQEAAGRGLRSARGTARGG